MTHDEMNELYELYVLGTLEPAQAAEMDGHVDTRCPYCLEHIQDATAVASAMSGMADDQRPPARLRRRILTSIEPEVKRTGWLFTVAGLGAACAALVVLAIWSGNSLRSYRAEIRDLQAERNQLQEALEILSKPETRAVQFGLANNQPRGRVFVNRDRGLIFVGTQLPQLDKNRIFQLWLIPTNGAPESAGVFQSSATGDSVDVRTTPIDTTRIHAVAVSVEPQGGSPAPTTTPIIVVPLA
jgi:hypothetical protein